MSMLDSVPDVLRPKVQNLVDGRKVASAVEAFHGRSLWVKGVRNKTQSAILHPLVLHDVGFSANVHGDRRIFEDGADSGDVKASFGVHVKLTKPVKFRELLLCLVRLHGEVSLETCALKVQP